MRVDVRCSLLLCSIVVLMSACASVPLTKTGEIPKGSEIVVISLRDCQISGQEEDCTGSGRKGGEAFYEVFSEEGKFKSKLVDRPVDAKEALSDEAAAEFARENGYDYVLNGEVLDFYAVAPMTFRVDRASVSIRIIRASDGQVMASHSQVGAAGSNFDSPKGMIKEIAEFVNRGL